MSGYYEVPVHVSFWVLVAVPDPETKSEHTGRFSGGHERSIQIVAESAAADFLADEMDQGSSESVGTPQDEWRYVTDRQMSRADIVASREAVESALKRGERLRKRRR